MHKQWADMFAGTLQRRKGDHLYRSLKIIDSIEGSRIITGDSLLINFASNDYLGLTRDRRLHEAGIEASERFGSGSGASRLISGTSRLFTDFEEAVAEWLGREKVLFFNSGYHANMGLLAALSDRSTTIYCDRLNHASIYDGIALSRGAMARYGHADIQSLKSIAGKTNLKGKGICVSDAVFSMDGDRAPVVELANAAKELELLTILDEAHSIGVFGSRGSGLVQQEGCSDTIDIVMGTLGKSFGLFGAFVAAEGDVIDYLVNTCRTFIYTTAVPPYIIGAAKKALEIIQDEGRGAALLDRAEQFRKELQSRGIDTGGSASQIIPILTGTNERALALQEWYRENGIFAPAIRPPTVPEGSSRVRISLSWMHSKEEIEKLLECTFSWFKKQGEL
jgi:8-amino-7-oxononanoate synthase